MSRPRVGALCAGVVMLASCEVSSDPIEPLPSFAAELRREITRRGAVPIGAMPPQPDAEIALGRALFFDPILSGNRDISCGTCHHPTAALGDALSLAIGTGGEGVGSGRTLGAGDGFVPRGAPSLLNVGLGLGYLLWDARVPGFGALDGAPQPPDSVDRPLVPRIPRLGSNLARQAFLPVLDRREMRGEPGDVDVFGNPNELAGLADTQWVDVWAAIMDRLLAIPEYVGMFRTAYPETPADALAFEHAARALATYQKAAFTRTESPFNRFLEGDDGALTVAEQRGARLFFGKAQCGSCHGGPFLGGQSFANVGAPQIGPGGAVEPPLDLGVAEHRGGEFYRFAFRVPPLLNVELTAPYFHSGAYATLDDVVRHYDDVRTALRSYDRSRLDPRLRDQVHDDPASIEAVLQTLDGRLWQPLDLHDEQQADLVAFLRSLTDPAARDLGAIAPTSVPSGLLVGG